MPHDFRVVPLTGDEAASRFLQVYPNNGANFPVEIDTENRFCIIAKNGEQFLERIQNFEVRRDDVWVVTMPKCGTTWMLELVWLLQNEFDYETALSVDQNNRCPFIEFCILEPSLKSIDAAQHLKSPRVIKSHLPMHMLPKGLWIVKPKIIYVARDPKDATVSFYHFLTGMGTNKASKEEFVSRVLDDRMSYGPFWPHVVEFWKMRNQPYVYFTSFERMKKDLRSIVLQICEFLQKTIDDEQMAVLLDHLSFEKMKNNPMCNHLTEMKLVAAKHGVENSSFQFIRKGVVGSHKEDLGEEKIEEFRKWTQRALEPHGVTSGEILTT